MKVASLQPDACSSPEETLVLRHSRFLFPAHHTTLKIPSPPGYLHILLAKTSFMGPARPRNCIGHSDSTFRDLETPWGFAQYSRSVLRFARIRPQYQYNDIHPMSTDKLQ